MAAQMKTLDAWIAARSYRAYLFALMLTALAFAVRLALNPILGGVQPFAFFYLSVALTAW